MKESMLIETTSPIDAANGVAKLSGFKRNFSDNNITATNTKSVKKKNNFCNYNIMMIITTLKIFVSKMFLT